MRGAEILEQRINQLQSQIVGMEALRKQKHSGPVLS